MLKGYCKYHKSNDLKDHILEIDERDEIIECPVCHRKIKRNDAIKTYHDKISHFLYWGRFNLFVSTNYLKAYRYFAAVLEIDENNVDGYSGRILSLFMMSTLRDSRFEDTKEMVIQAFSLLAKNRTNHKSIIFMLSTLDKFVHKYIKLVKKKLTHKIYFHDNKCVKLYLTRVKEARDLRIVILKEVEQLINRNQKNDFNDFEQIRLEIKKSLDRDEHDLSTYQVCLDGYSYKALFDKKGDMVIIDDGLKQKINLSSYHPFAIKKEKGKYQIRDRVFTSYSKQYQFFIYSAVIIILLFVLAIASTICCFVFSELRHILLISALSLALLAVLFIIIRFSLYLIIRKRIKNSLN